MRIVAVGRSGGHGPSFEPAGLKTSSATVVARAATKEKRSPRLGPTLGSGMAKAVVADVVVAVRNVAACS